ncbi:class I SAM-dependent RNA methyltransferase (plasmid) [Qingshengfaniella alkalisoli]|uniref:Class I SAM-dependent RNA methyltransferase n=2 Tax=Qingshengfaniella alkalisoli TaxID=2599296 RepID=A0A5B8JBW3_9RHOB|nr:class I SAM-dependent RNA methyltransferase [Qingshengfaniella alkalisoli]
MVMVTINRLGHLGDGIAEGPVYAARTLPGEIVTGDLDGDRIAAPKIVEPSPVRVSPSCRHYKSCGGCALQHASDAFVADWKIDVVRQALLAQGLDAPIRGISTSPARSRRRAAFSGRRTKKGALVGFHGRGSGTLTEIPDCDVVSDGLKAALPALEDITRVAGSRKGEITFTVTQTLTGLDLRVDGAKPLDQELSMALPAIVEKHALARLSWGDEPFLTREPPIVTMGAARVPLPAGAFLQATEHGEQALLSAVRDAVGDAPRIADLFAGCGTFTLPLAEHAELHAVESEPMMLAALDQGWRHAQGLKPVTTETRDLFRRPLMADELCRFDAAVIDPPRAGAEAQMQELASAAIPRIAAVSCNPVTFARDAAVLCAAGYELGWIQIVDQFRWSTHVELAASFVLP